MPFILLTTTAYNIRTDLVNFRSTKPPNKNKSEGAMKKKVKSGIPSAQNPSSGATRESAIRNIMFLGKKWGEMALTIEAGLDTHR